VPFPEPLSVKNAGLAATTGNAIVSELASLCSNTTCVLLSPASEYGAMALT
jgi:hypothetical protein